jgi:hypothetical protein
MKLYGYLDNAAQDRPSALSEAALAATPEELRRIAAFLAYCADEMERMGEAFDHLHLEDFERGFEGGPGLVIARRAATGE